MDGLEKLQLKVKKTAKKEDSMKTFINKELTRRGAYYEKTFAGTKDSGIPDVYFCYNGYFVAFETKRPTEKGKHGVLSFQQMKHLDKINANGGVAVVPASKEFILDVLNALEKKDEQWLLDNGWRSHKAKLDMSPKLYLNKLW